MTTCAHAHSAALLGLRSVPVEIEAVGATGEPGLTIKGLSDPACRETRVRVLSALNMMGVQIPCSVSVQVSDGAHSSSAFDLAVACAVLGALGLVSLERLDTTLLLGELNLSGQLHHSRGVLSRVLNRLQPDAIVPARNRNEASFAKTVFVADTLAEVMAHLQGATPLPVAVEPTLGSGSARDWAHGPGIDQQADEIIASGMRRVLLVGSPSSGKLMLARAIAARLGPAGAVDALENVQLHSASGLLQDDGASQWLTRPFRAPHHSISEVGLLGGGLSAWPGEVSLANHGVLLLDEVGEFRRTALEGLGRALRLGVASFGRRGELVTLPARPAFVIGTTTPCGCGYHGSARLLCRCPPASIERHRARSADSGLDFELTWRMRN